MNLEPEQSVGGDEHTARSTEIFPDNRAKIEIIGNAPAALVLTAGNGDQKPVSAAAEVVSTRQRLVLSGIVTALALLFLFSPWPLQAKLRSIGHACCAQIPSHTIRFDGQAMPIDSRNSGIYAGVLMVVAIMWLTGRRKAALFVPAKVRNLLMLFVLAMIFDGFNSLAQTHNLHMYYEPSNTIRAVTGTLSGMALAILTLPLFNMLVWRDPEVLAIAEDYTDLVGYLAGAVVIIITLLQAPLLLYYPLSILTIAGLLLTLTFVNTCIGIVAFRRQNSIGSLSKFIIPSLAGLLSACLEIMAFDLWRAFQH
jgi:uncharacterized membrane protein